MHCLLANALLEARSADGMTFASKGSEKVWSWRRLVQQGYGKTGMEIDCKEGGGACK